MENEIQFNGSVHLNDTTQNVVGQWKIIFEGKITILSSKQVLGFDVGEREEKWFVSVETEKTIEYIPGCKIKQITRLKE